MSQILKLYGHIIEKMVENSHKRTMITKDDVYQTANLKNQAYFDQIVSDLMLEPSTILQSQNLLELYRKAQEGYSCMILMEHYSNFDLPCFHNLIRKALPDQGRAIADSLIAIAGTKLNEESPMVLAFTEAYNRIIIYPSRSLSSITDPQLRAQEEQRSRAINLNSLKILAQKKSEGQLILVFPSGTRYREGQEETKQGLKEIDSYLKSFDYCLFSAINGNVLYINNEHMAQDDCKQDLMLYALSPVTSCKEFRAKVRKQQEPSLEEDVLKQRVANAIMQELDKLHSQTEVKRQALLESL